MFFEGDGSDYSLVYFPSDVTFSEDAFSLDKIGHHVTHTLIRGRWYLRNDSWD